MLGLEEKTHAFLKVSSIHSSDALVIPGWEKGEWTTLFSYTTEMKLASGTTLIRQEVTDRTLYFLVSGVLEAAVSYGEQTLAPLRVVYPGSVVGEVAFFDGGPRSARVWAVEDSELLGLGTADYSRFAGAHLHLANDLLLGLGRLVAFRLRQLTVRGNSKG